MKRQERHQARSLRSQGGSIKSIAKKLCVSKSSVSVWVRDIELTPEQTALLSEKGVNIAVIERRRRTRLENSKLARESIMAVAGKMLGKISKRDLLIAGIALYWGEGGKTSKGAARLSNSDPNAIRLMMRFFRTICHVPEEKFRGGVHIHSHLDTTKAERFWSDVSGISRSQFYKAYTKPSKASKGKKDSLPYGTFDLYVNDTKLFWTIMGWIRKIQAS